MNNLNIREKKVKPRVNRFGFLIFVGTDFLMVFAPVVVMVVV
jgi:hypothetical protein